MLSFMTIVMPVMAQETYEDARLVGDDLNGTARYVGMGGAMEALGADISTIGTNPAAIGLFRHSYVGTSFGLITQQDAKDFRNGYKTNLSFDQIGFVYSMESGDDSYLNLAFNYHKSKNFNYLLSVADGLMGRGSQNMLSFAKAIDEVDRSTGQTDFGFDLSYGMGTAYSTSQLDNVYYNSFIVGPGGESVAYNSASDYLMNRANTGYIGTYDVNISGNIHNRVYLGLTVGIYGVHYKGISEYIENLLDWENKYAGSVCVTDERKVTGTGYDVKAGIIVRPIETSPLRFGLSISSPTFYKLTTENYTYMTDNTGYDVYNKSFASSASYDFAVRTPWKFGLSAGHTLGRSLALGASVEYADYSSLDTRVITGEQFRWYGDYSDNTESDNAMNSHTEETLKGVATLKVGAEFKPDPSLAVRLGYNYITPMYNENAFKDGFIDSYGSNCSSATDYINWKGTNRITCGVGYKYQGFSIDLAYQYTVKSGNFSPFGNGWGDFYHYGYDDNGNTIVDDKGNPVVFKEEIDVFATPKKVDFKRHQLLLSLSYTF